jgi:hypothetical protein
METGLVTTIVINYIHQEIAFITKPTNMKKILALIAAFAIMVNSFAAFPLVDKPAKKASEIMVPIGKDMKISLLDLATISPSQLEKLTGKKMNLIEKAGFRIAQKDLRKSINSDGTVNSKKFEKLLKKADGSSGFHLGGFALGFLLGLIGVLIAYLIKDENKSARTKWAWLGLLTAVVLSILLFLL